MPDKPCVLLVEDEASIRRFLKPTLEGHGFKVVEALTGEEGLSLAPSHRPDLVLLDLGLPDRDGLEVLKAFREWSKAPVIILTARGKEKDKIEGLDAGADDYLTKPFDMGELLARIRVALRHARQAERGEVEPLFRVPGLEVDLEARKVKVRGRETHLTPQEYDLLALMVRHAGKVLTQTQILKEVWGPATSPDQAATLRLFIHQLRQKIESDPARPRYIQTEPGVGYRLRAE
jgi:two-component system KDP operon response regulator KdpE